MSAKWNPAELAARMRRWLVDHPDAYELTVPMMQRVLGGNLDWDDGRDDRAEYLPPHFVEQAFQILNISGELSHAGARQSACACGDHRAAIYRVRRKA